MFSEGDKEEQARIADTLDAAGYTTYLPQRDGIEVGRVIALVKHPETEPKLIEEAMSKVRQWVFALDIYQLLGRCQSLVFNLDGRTPDEGSVVETAAAFASGKPIVIYKTTPITILDGTDNPMVQGLSSTWTYVEDVQGLTKALGEAIDAANLYAYDPPPNIAALRREGEAVWNALQKVREMPLESEAELKQWLETISKEVEATGAPAVT
jgi:nucleoside 2-deoxyribosyltransferase